MDHILIPIFICVVLPVAIVYIVFRTIKNKDDKNAEIIIKAIENNSDIDADKFIAALGQPQKSPMQILQKHLLRGCIFTFLGLVAMIATTIFNVPTIEQNLEPEDIAGWLVSLVIIGGCCLAIGVAYLVTYFITRKSIDKDCH